MGKLVQARLLELFVDNDGQLVWRVAKGKAPAGAVCEGRTNNGYYRVRVDGVYQLVHRVLWTMRHGDIPAELLVDHRDGNGYNNSIDNLRLATHGQNMQNAITHTGNTSGHEVCTGTLQRASGRYSATPMGGTTTVAYSSITVPPVRLRTPCG